MKSTEKTCNAVKFMLQQRDKLSGKLSKMTKEEMLQYFKNHKTQTTLKQQPKGGILCSTVNYKLVESLVYK